MPNELDHTRNLIIGQRMAGLANLDYGMLDDILDIFLDYQGMISDFAGLFAQSDRLGRLLKVFPTTSDVETVLALAEKGWFALASSAGRTLRSDISGYWISPSNRETHESTSSNQTFGADPIRIEEGEWETHFNLLVSLVQDYDGAAKTPAFFFPSIPQYIM